MTQHTWRDNWQVWLLDDEFKPLQRLDNLTRFSMDWKLRDQCSFTANMPTSSEHYTLMDADSDQYLFVVRADDTAAHAQVFAIENQEHKWAPVRGKITKTLEIAGQGGAAFFLSRRIIQPNPAGTVDTWTAGGKADDAIKDAIRYNCVTGTAYDDPESEARGIPGLTVAANKTEHPTTVSLPLSGDLWAAVENLCRTYEVDLTFTPAWNGKDAAVTFAIDTFYQGRGADKTPGNANPVVLSDRYGVLADSSWHYNKFPVRTHAYAQTGRAVLAADDAADHLRAEILTEGASDDELARVLEKHRAEQGHEFEFIETEAIQLGRDFWLGDTISHGDNELGTRIKDELVSGVKITIQQDSLGSEKIELTFGDEKPQPQSGGGGGSPWAPEPVPGGTGAVGYWDRTGTLNNYVLFPNRGGGDNVTVCIGQDAQPADFIDETWLDVNGHVRITAQLYSTTSSVRLWGNTGAGYCEVDCRADSTVDLPVLFNVFSSAEAGSTEFRLDPRAASTGVSFLSGLIYLRKKGSTTNWGVLDFDAATPTVDLWSGSNFRMYSDAGSTLKFDVDGSTGYITSASNALLKGNTLYLGDTSTYITRNTGSSALSFTTDQGYVQFRPSATTVVQVSTSAVRPGASNTYTLGDATPRRWSNVYSVLGNYSGQITSSLATGTSPFAVSSTTVCSNLNADLHDGFHATQAATDGCVVVREADGDIAMKAAATVDGVDISTHVHVVSGNTGTSNPDLTGNSGGYAFDGDVGEVYTENVVHDLSGTEVWLRTFSSQANAAADTSATGQKCSVGARNHYHVLTGTAGGLTATGKAATHTHAVSIESAVPGAL